MQRVCDADLRQWKIIKQDCDDIQGDIHRNVEGFTPVSDLLEN